MVQEYLTKDSINETKKDDWEASLLFKFKPNSEYRFDSYVTGNTNHLAYIACKHLVEDCSSSYRFLLLFGPRGVGKTHLLNSIGSYSQQNEASVIYCSIRDFVAYYELFGSNVFSEFLKRCDQSNTILLDDFDFINKTDSRFQTILLSALRRRYSEGCRIAMSFNSPPEDIALKADEIYRFLKYAIIVEIKPPTEELLCSILEIEKNKQKTELSDERLNSLYKKVNDTETLKQIIGQFALSSNLSKSSETLELANAAINRINQYYYKPDFFAPISAVNIVARHLGMTTEDISGSSQIQRIALARQISMYILKKGFGLSLDEIGQLLGNRDHSTVAYGYNKISKEVTKGERISILVKELWKIILPDKERNF